MERKKKKIKSGWEKLFLLIVINSIGFKEGTSQNRSIDSLLKVAETVQGTARIDALNEVSRQYGYALPAKAVQYAGLSYEEAVHINYLKGQGYALRNLALAYSYKKDFSFSIEFSRRSLQILEGLKDSVGIGNNYITLGLIYHRGDPWQGVEYFQKALTIFQKLNIPERIGVCKHDMAFSYYDLGQLNLAEKLESEALILLQAANYQTVVTSCYRDLGLIAKSKGNIPDAICYFNEAIEISKQLGADAQKAALIESILSLANIYKGMGNTRSELAYLQFADSTAQRYVLPEQQCTICQLLVEYYLEQKDFSNTSHYMLKLREANNLLALKEREDWKHFMSFAQSSLKIHQEKNQLEIAGAEQKKLIGSQQQWLIGMISILLLVVTLFIIVFRNNKIQKKLNTQLARQHEEIRKKTLALEQLNQTKDKFFGIVAHDIRSPLNSLLSFAELVSRHIDQLSKEEIKKYALNLHEMVSNTLRMAENLITWARVQMRQNIFKPEMLELTTVAREVCQFFLPMTNQKQVILEMELSTRLPVFADKEQMTFIIRNLMNNALKFTPRCGRIEIRSGVIDHEHLFLKIKDTGVGMNEETIQKLFKAGAIRSTPGTEGEKGTGLGMMLSQEFIKLNQGRLEVESSVGKGSCLCIVLPIYQPGISPIDFQHDNLEMPLLQ